jgi:hypothetical protein
MIYFYIVTESTIKFVKGIIGRNLFKFVVLNPEILDFRKIDFELRIRWIKGIVSIINVFSSTKLRSVEVVVLKDFLKASLAAKPVLRWCQQSLNKIASGRALDMG